MTTSQHPSSRAQPTSAAQWRPLALRLTVLVLPAQLVGAFLGFLPTLLLGPRILDVPWVSSLVLVGMGLVAGAAVGRFATPPYDRGRAPLVLVAGFGLVAFLLLRLLVQIRLPEGSSPGVLAWVIGGVVVVLLQTWVTALLWRRRSARGDA